ncbi:MAG TPA: ribosomal protein S18-alanine N-acetyltransferase [Gemmatimonadaceae bacterium]|nr:ribosomal protein S18-alanine N-acetyltransferase [Gemmatimonadaceae bacterium]
MSQLVRADTTIRTAALEDLRLVASIESESFTDPWSERSFAEILLSPAAIFLVAARSDSRKLVGYIIALVVGSESEILNLATAPSVRRQGLGGDLLDAGMAAVDSRGANEIFLEVRESNQSALGLYRSRGFLPIGHRPKYYRNPVEDALVLRRAIER